MDRRRKDAAAPGAPTCAAPAPGSRRLRASFAVAGVCVAALFAYYWFHWRTLDAFVRAMDHCELLFCDFKRFSHPMAQQLLSLRRPVFGYFYPAFFALLLYPLGRLPLETAVWIWGAVQWLSAGLLCYLTGWKLLTLSAAGRALCVPLFLASMPMLHNYKWGQVSVLLTLGVLAALHCYRQGRVAGAAVLLAAVVSVKYYPVLFLAYPLMQRNYRFLAWFAGATAVFFVLVPVAAMGPADAWEFQREISQAVAGMSRAPYDVFDPNSQFAAHVIARWFGLKGPAYGWMLQGFGVGVLLANAGLGWISLKRRSGNEALVPAAVLTFLSLPFVVKTSWPHYFVYLPFCQAAVLSEAAKQARGAAAPALLSLAPAIASVALSSIFVFNAFPNWRQYSNSGMLFVSNALLLLALYALLSGERVRDRRRCGRIAV